MKISWLALVVVVAPSIGCDKKEAAPVAAPAPEKAAAAPAPTAATAGAAKAATCPPGYKNPKPDFCITLPAGVTAEKPTLREESGNISFSNGTNVKWLGTNRYDQELANIEGMATVHANATDVHRGATPGGGKFTSWNWGGQYSLASVVKGKNWVFTCVASDAKADSPALQACQSLVTAD
jgi:hypothetical protein